MSEASRRRPWERAKTQGARSDAYPQVKENSTKVSNAAGEPGAHAAAKPHGESSDAYALAADRYAQKQPSKKIRNTRDLIRYYYTESAIFAFCRAQTGILTTSDMSRTCSENL